MITTVPNSAQDVNRNKKMREAILSDDPQSTTTLNALLATATSISINYVDPEDKSTILALAIEKVDPNKTQTIILHKDLSITSETQIESLPTIDYINQRTGLEFPKITATQPQGYEARINFFVEYVTNNIKQALLNNWAQEYSRFHKKILTTNTESLLLQETQTMFLVLRSSFKDFTKEPFKEYTDITKLGEAELQILLNWLDTTEKKEMSLGLRYKFATVRAYLRTKSQFPVIRVPSVNVVMSDLQKIQQDINIRLHGRVETIRENTTVIREIVTGSSTTTSTSSVTETNIHSPTSSTTTSSSPSATSAAAYPTTVLQMAAGIIAKASTTASTTSSSRQVASYYQTSTLEEKTDPTKAWSGKPVDWLPTTSTAAITTSSTPTATAAPQTATTSASPTSTSTSTSSNKLTTPSSNPTAATTAQAVKNNSTSLSTSTSATPAGETSTPATTVQSTSAPTTTLTATATMSTSTTSSAVATPIRLNPTPASTAATSTTGNPLNTTPNPSSVAALRARFNANARTNVTPTKLIAPPASTATRTPLSSLPASPAVSSSPATPTHNVGSSPLTALSVINTANSTTTVVTTSTSTSSTTTTLSPAATLSTGAAHYLSTLRGASSPTVWLKSSSSSSNLAASSASPAIKEAPKLSK